MKLACLGLGPMGVAMASRLVDAGHDVRVWNRSPGNAAALVARGAQQAGSPAEAVAGAEAMLTSLAHDAAVEAVLFGPAAAVLPAGAVHVSLSTISVALSRQLAEAHAGIGQGFVAAPVLGRPPAAEAGQLFVMAAGPEAAIATVRPLLDRIGQRVFLLGERPEGANLMKLLCNFLIFTTVEQLSEVFALGRKGGLEAEAVFELLTESFFTAPVHKNYGRLILEGAFDPPGATVALGAKDTRLVLAAAEALAVPMPLASLLRDRFLAATARGEAGLDFTVIARQAAEAAGLD